MFSLGVLQISMSGCMSYTHMGPLKYLSLALSGFTVFTWSFPFIILLFVFFLGHFDTFRYFSIYMECLFQYPDDELSTTYLCSYILGCIVT